MRLSEKYQTIIKTTFVEVFPDGDHLWLFGSRVDDTKRGGDINLYIETNLDTWEDAHACKSRFWGKPQMRLGEQKIDIVVNSLKTDGPQTIFEEARNTGILLI